MKKYLPIIGGLIVILALVFLNRVPQQALGSVEQSHEYQSTTTAAGWGNAAQIAVLVTGAGALGSVINTIGPVNDGTFCLYDATTTDTTLRNNIATSSIVLTCFKTKTILITGTLTFDVRVKNGLLADFSTAGGPTNFPTTTITYRQY